MNPNELVYEEEIEDSPKALISLENKSSIIHSRYYRKP
jgi:hypothetical protein